jgi:hypothetical protein
VGELEKDDGKHLDHLEEQAAAEYAKAAGESGGQASRVYGPGAALLKNLQKSVDGLVTSADARTTAQFEEQFAEVFANSGNKELVGLVSQGAHINGRLYIECTARLEDGRWRMGACDDAWVLWTNSPNPTRVAEALKDSMEDQGKSVVQSHLEKKVRVTLNIDSGSAFTINNRDDVSISFTDIEKPSFGTADAVRHGDDPQEANVAWKAVIKAKVASIAKVTGRNG